MKFVPIAALALLSVAAVARGDTCRLVASIAGHQVTMTHCAIAVYDESGATLFFSETPIGEDERATFLLNSYAKETDPSGKRRSMMHFGFCPGGGKPTADAGAVKSVEVSVNYAPEPILQRQWVIELPKDSTLQFERLSGSLAPGGRLAGRITGARTSDGQRYTWEAEFDLTLPSTGAMAGVGCGQ